MKSKHILLLIITIISLFNTINSVLYEKIVYNQYIASVSGSPDYHELTISWSNKVLINEEDGVGTWTYSLLRVEQVDSEGKSNQSTPAFLVYANYLINSIGVLPPYQYVAWWATTPDCTGDIISLKFYIKYFTCELPAINFYNDSTTISAGSMKIRASDVGWVEGTGTHTIGVTAVDIKNFLGLGDFAFVSLCFSP